VTGLLASVGAPTNYFSYVSPADIKGLGPFTNDTACTYAHGWTNWYTVAAGTNNLPAGRTQWYTSDYGKQYIPMMLNRLFLIQNQDRWDLDPDLGVTYSAWGGTWSDEGMTNWWEGDGETNVYGWQTIYLPSQPVPNFPSLWDDATDIAATNVDDSIAGTDYGMYGKSVPENRYQSVGVLDVNGAFPDPPGGRGHTWDTAADWDSRNAYWLMRADVCSNTPAFLWYYLVYYVPYGIDDDTVVGGSQMAPGPVLVPETNYVFYTHDSNGDTIMDKFQDPGTNGFGVGMSGATQLWVHVGGGQYPDPNPPTNQTLFRTGLYSTVAFGPDFTVSGDPNECDFPRFGYSATGGVISCHFITNYWNGWGLYGSQLSATSTNAQRSSVMAIMDFRFGFKYKSYTWDNVPPGLCWD